MCVWKVKKNWSSIKRGKYPVPYFGEGNIILTLVQVDYEIYFWNVDCGGDH